jgi:hypothetical protein
MRTRTWRRALVAVVVVTLAGLAGQFVANQLARPRWDAVRRIQNGMTRAQVEAIVGCPPGDYGTHEPEAPHGSIWVDETEDHTDGYTTLRWTDDHNALVVELQDECGCVTFVHQPAVGPGFGEYEADFLDAFRWRIQRQWRRWFPSK